MLEMKLVQLISRELRNGNKLLQQLMKLLLGMMVMKLIILVFMGLLLIKLMPVMLLWELRKLGIPFQLL